jgi:hypothetical protein
MEKKPAYAHAHAPSVALHAFRALAWLRHPLKRRKKNKWNYVAVKSSLRAMLRDKSCPLSLRLSFFGGAALTPGAAPPELSTFPSTSSSGREAAAVCAAVLGSFEGWVG